MAQDNRQFRTGYNYCFGESNTGSSTTYSSIDMRAPQQSTFWKKSFKKDGYVFDEWLTTNSNDKETVLIDLNQPEMITSFRDTGSFLHRDLIFINSDVANRMVKLTSVEFDSGTNTIIKHAEQEIEFSPDSSVPSSATKIIIFNKEVNTSNLISEGSAYKNMYIPDDIYDALKTSYGYLLVEFCSVGDFVRKETFEQDLDVTAKVVFNEVRANTKSSTPIEEIENKLKLADNEVTNRGIPNSEAWLPAIKHVKSLVLEKLYKVNGTSYYNLPKNTFDNELGYSFNTIDPNYSTESPGLALYSKIKPDSVIGSTFDSFNGIIQYNSKQNTLEFGQAFEFYTDNHSNNLLGNLPFVPKIKGSYTDILPGGIPYFIQEITSGGVSQAQYERTRETLKYSNIFRVVENGAGTEIEKLILPSLLSVTDSHTAPTYSSSLGNGLLKLLTDSATAISYMECMDSYSGGLFTKGSKTTLFSSTTSVDENNITFNQTILSMDDSNNTLEIGRKFKNADLSAFVSNSITRIFGKTIELESQFLTVLGDFSLNPSMGYTAHIPKYHKVLGTPADYSGVFKTFSKIQSPTIDYIHNEIESIILGGRTLDDGTTIIPGVKSTAPASFNSTINTISALTYWALPTAFALSDYNTEVPNPWPAIPDNKKVRSLVDITDSLLRVYYDVKTLTKFVELEKAYNSLGSWQITKKTDLKVSTNNTEDKVLDLYKADEPLSSIQSLTTAEYGAQSVVTGDGKIVHASNMMILAIE